MVSRIHRLAHFTPFAYIAYIAILVACVSVVDGAATIQTLSYPSGDCTGTSSVDSTATAGACITEDNESKASYCTPNGVVMRAYFNGATCDANLVHQVARETSNDCSRISDTLSQIYHCVDIEQGPASPIGDFPPTADLGFSPVSIYVTLATNAFLSQCPVDLNNLPAGVGPGYESYRKLGMCSATATASKKDFCSEDGKLVVSYNYAGYICSGSYSSNTVTMANCNYAQVKTSCEGSPTLPVPLPNNGIVVVNADFTCEVPTGATGPAQVLLWPGECASTAKFICNGDGTATYTKYTTVGCTGSVTRTITQVADGKTCGATTGFIFICGDAPYSGFDLSVLTPNDGSTGVPNDGSTGASAGITRYASFSYQNSDCTGAVVSQGLERTSGVCTQSGAYSYGQYCTADGARVEVSFASTGCTSPALAYEVWPYKCSAGAISKCIIGDNGPDYPLTTYPPPESDFTRVSRYVQNGAVVLGCPALDPADPFALPADTTLMTQWYTRYGGCELGGKYSTYCSMDGKKMLTYRFTSRTDCSGDWDTVYVEDTMCDKNNRRTDCRNSPRPLAALPVSGVIQVSRTMGSCTYDANTNNVPARVTLYKSGYSCNNLGTSSTRFHCNGDGSGTLETYSSSTTCDFLQTPTTQTQLADGVLCYNGLIFHCGFADPYYDVFYRYSDGSTGVPNDGSTGVPNDGSTGRPNDGSTGRPNDGSTGQPNDGSTGRPNDGSTGRPNDGSTRAPQANNDGSTGAPKSNDGSTGAPKSNDGSTGAPAGTSNDGSTKAPVAGNDGSTGRPNDGSTGRPNDGSTGAAPSAYQTRVLADKPSHYWRFGESSGQVAADLGSVGLAATYSTGTTLGLPGAILNDGNTAVSLPGEALISTTTYCQALSNAGTVEAWVKLSAAPASGDFENVIVAKLDYVSKQHNYFMNFVRGRVVFGTFDTTTASYKNVTSAKSTWGLNEWFHIVASWNGATAQIYINGVANGASVALVATPPNFVSNDVRCTIGSDFTTSLHTVRGDIDEVAVYTSALSAAAVKAHYDTARTVNDGSTGAPNDGSTGVAGSVTPVITLSGLTAGITVNPNEIIALKLSSSVVPGAGGASFTLTCTNNGTSTLAFPALTFSFGQAVSTTASQNLVVPSLLAGKVIRCTLVVERTSNGRDQKFDASVIQPFVVTVRTCDPVTCGAFVQAMPSLLMIALAVVMQFIVRQ